MNSSNTGPLIISGIFKSILCDALAGLLCNELNTLYNTINNLKIYKSKKDSGKIFKLFRFQKQNANNSIPKYQKVSTLGKQQKTMTYNVLT